jgi:hypothetical protein
MEENDGVTVADGGVEELGVVRVVEHLTSVQPSEGSDKTVSDTAASNGTGAAGWLRPYSSDRPV